MCAPGPRDAGGLEVTLRCTGCTDRMKVHFEAKYACPDDNLIETSLSYTISTTLESHKLNVSHRSSCEPFPALHQSLNKRKSRRYEHASHMLGL
jgi:hypothetical protein